MITYEAAPEFKKQLLQVFEAYLPLQAALAADDLESAKATASQLGAALDKVDMKVLDNDAHMEWMNQLAPIRGSGDLIRTAPNIATARAAFLPLSKTLIRVAHVFNPAFPSPLEHARCPMAFKIPKSADDIKARGRRGEP